MPYLVFQRLPGEEIAIGDDVVITFLETRPDGRSVRIGISAPRAIPVHRAEVAARIRDEVAAEEERPH